MVGFFRRHRGLRFAAVVAVSTVALPLLPAHAATGVRTTEALEFAPSAVPGALAWTQAPRSRPSRANAYLKESGTSPRRLNARGTKGYTTGGAIDESGSRVAYWQRSGASANIKFFNRATGRRSAPRFVNTSRHEWGAAVSGKWLLFARGRYGGPMSVHVANLQTKSVRRLARVRSGGYLAPGDVSGRWATWTRCSGFRNCSILRENLKTKGRVRLPNPRGLSQFASSVLRNGTVFYGESRNNATCDSTLRIYRKPAAGNRTHVATLTSGTSISATSAARVSASRVAVYYDQQRCDSPRANIYRVSVPG